MFQGELRVKEPSPLIPLPSDGRGEPSAGSWGLAEELARAESCAPQAARASWANSLNRVSSPSWADQMARSWPRAMRPWAVSQRSLALGCLANSSRPTSPPYTAMAWGLEEKARMREPLSNLMTPTLTCSTTPDGWPCSSSWLTDRSSSPWERMVLVRLKISANL